MFDGPDGTKLHDEWYAPTSKPRATVLITHGYAEHGGRYKELAETIAAAGFAAMTWDYRGHGRAGGKRGHISSWSEYLGDLDAAVAVARDKGGGAPVILLGQSHGALIILTALEKRAPAGVEAAVLSSPWLGVAMKVPMVKVAAGKLMSRVFPSLSMSNELDPKNFTHDEGKLAEYRADTLCHHVATARWYTEAMSAQARCLEDAGRVTIPTLWLVSGDDHISDVATTRRVFEKAGPSDKDKELRVYDGFFHEIWNEVKRKDVMAELVTWLGKRHPM
jgi:alpha-beta hydrolase superfamily lysophospholipase